MDAYHAEIDHPLLKTPLAIEHQADFGKWDARGSSVTG